MSWGELANSPAAQKDNCKLSKSCPSCRHNENGNAKKYVVKSCLWCSKNKNDNIDNKRQHRVRHSCA